MDPSISRHGKHYELARRQARVLWPQERYRAADVSPSSCRQTTFGDFEVRLPGDAEGYLTRTYGSEWARAGRGHDYDHVTRERRVGVEEFGLAGSLLDPAKPFR